MDKKILQQTAKKALDSQLKRESIKTKALKLAGINAHLQAVLQKRARLDLEIKQIKRRMTKLRQSLKTPTKASLKESAGISPTDAFLEYLSETSYLSQYKDILDEADHLLEELAQVPLLEI